MNGQYTSNDPEGHIVRLEVSFVFNLTLNSPPSLVSVMIITVNDTNATTSINNAIVNCAGEEAYPKVLHVYKGIIVLSVVILYLECLAMRI